MKIHQLVSKPTRKCFSMHECCLCKDKIVLGEQYYDGGSENRAHKKCADTAYEINGRIRETSTDYTEIIWEK